MAMFQPRRYLSKASSMVLNGSRDAPQWHQCTERPRPLENHRNNSVWQYCLTRKIEFGTASIRRTVVLSRNGPSTVLRSYFYLYQPGRKLHQRVSEMAVLKWLLHIFSPILTTQIVRKNLRAVLLYFLGKFTFRVKFYSMFIIKNYCRTKNNAIFRCFNRVGFCCSGIKHI